MIDEIEKILNHHGTAACLPCGRYGFSFSAKNGEERACFYTVPIMSQTSLVKKRFVKADRSFVFRGSNANVTVLSSGILLQNTEGEFSLSWAQGQNFVLSEDARFLYSEDLTVYPTANGVCVTQDYQDALYFTLKCRSKRKGNIRMNSKCFAYMKEKFRPYMIFNAMCAIDKEKTKFVGAELGMKQESDTKFRFRMRATDPLAVKLMWEINMYEPKPIQDTTVESRRPKENNAYGDVSFLGHTKDHGTQYLYTKFDFSRIGLASNKAIDRVLLHIPYYGPSCGGVRVFAPAGRFCSFGSNWSNKKSVNHVTVNSGQSNNCLVLDLSQYLIDQHGKIKENTGIVICPEKDSENTVFATADNYFTPQMIEIHYKKEKKV